MEKYKNGGLLCEEGEYAIALRQKSMGRLRTLRAEDDDIPSESAAEESKKLPDAPGSKSVSKASLEAAPVNVRKSSTTPSRIRRLCCDDVEELGDSVATPRTPTMSVNSSRFFDELEAKSERLQMCMTKNGYMTVKGEKKYEGVNYLKVIK